MDQLKGLGFGPRYTKMGPGGRIVPTGSMFSEDVPGLPASPLAGGEDLEINPWPENSVMEENMRGMGAMERFARVAKWGGDIVDLDRRPLYKTGTEMEGFIEDAKFRAKQLAKSYWLPIGLGIGGAILLGIVFGLRRKRRKNPCLSGRRGRRMVFRRRSRRRR